MQQNLTDDTLGAIVQASVLSVGCACVRSCRPGNDVKVAVVKEQVWPSEALFKSCLVKLGGGC